ncbi:MAG: T9SS type A sorting domain-containing protein, partial [Cytophagales bacterium]
LSAATFNVTVGGASLLIPTTAVAASFTDIDGQTPVKFKVTTLPSNGVLSISGMPVVLNQEYSVASITGLAYSPNANATTDTDSFAWNASDGFVYATSPAIITINIATIAGVVSTTGINNNASESNVSLYPVPVVGNTLYVNLTEGAYGLITATVYDVLGSLVLETNTYSLSTSALLEIPVSSLPKGAYILRLVTSDKIMQKRFVK